MLFNSGGARGLLFSLVAIAAAVLIPLAITGRPGVVFGMGDVVASWVEWANVSQTITETDEDGADYEEGVDYEYVTYDEIINGE
ncbi:MAG TPA: hypothetical protein VGE52_18285 [Pirellulales bacterium]